MNILQIVPSLKPSGPVNVSCDLVNIFTDNRHGCYVLYFDECSNKCNFNAECFCFSQYNDIPWDKIDIVHAHGYRPTRLLNRIRKEYPNIARVTTIHNYVFNDFKYEYGYVKGGIASLMFLYAVLKSKSSIVTLSNDAQKYYKKLLPGQRIYSSYNSRQIEHLIIDKDDLQIFDNLKKENVVLGIVSVLNKRKNIASAIKVMKFLPDNYTLCIIGSGPDENNLKLLSQKLGLCNRILFLGFRNRAYRYMNYFDLYLLPSKSEGFPLSLIEASAAKCGSVVANLPMIKEVYTDKKDIIITDPDNYPKFANDIKLAYKTKGLGYNAYDIYCKNFTLQKLYDRYFDIYCDAINLLKINSKIETR